MFRLLRTSLQMTSLVAVCLAFVPSTAQAQSPSSLSENSYEYFAYVYSYSAKALSSNLPLTISNATNSTDYQVLLAVETMLRTEEAFQYSLNALQTDNNSLWYMTWSRSIMAQQAATELFELTGNQQAKSIAWYSELAAENALDAFIASGAPIPSLSRNTNRDSGR